MEDASAGFWLLIIGIGILIYLLPTVVAFCNSHSYKWIIFLINLFFGFTGIVWIVMFIWAIFPKDKSLASPIISPTGDNTAGKHIANATKDVVNAIKETNGSDMISELKKLTELKDCGAINEEEFQRMKKDVFAKHGNSI